MQIDERIAQCLHLDSWLSWTIVHYQPKLRQYFTHRFGFVVVDKGSVFALVNDEIFEVVGFDIVPLILGFGLEDLLELRDGGFFVFKGSSLIFARIAESAPTSRQHVQVFASLMDHL